MSRKNIWLTGLLIWVFLTSGALLLAQENKKEVALTLEEAIFRALKQNLNLVAEVYTFEKSTASLSLAREMFYPKL